VSGREADPFGVPPEPFERIVLADILEENVHDHVPEVHEDPFRGGRTFDAERSVSLCGENAVDVIRDRAGLTLRFPGTQHEIVCN
jgi:hypothetical protein